MKHLLKTCLVFTFLLQAIIAKTQFIYEDAQVKAVFNYKLDCSGNDTVLLTSFDLHDIASGALINYGNLTLNDGNVRNKEALDNLLSGLYSNVAKKYGVKSLREYTPHIRKMIESVAAKLDTRQLHSLIFQALCMYYSVSQASNRDVEERGEVSFTVMESYLNGLSSFSVEEDNYYNIQAFRDYLTKLKSVQPQNPGIDYYLGALKDVKAETLNMVEITALLQEYFNNNLSARWPQGTECGCCGNYSGDCYYWSKICLAHDYACQSCTPRWACFSGCVASSCSGNTISWYWWLL